MRGRKSKNKKESPPKVSLSAAATEVASNVQEDPKVVGQESMLRKVWGRLPKTLGKAVFYVSTLNLLMWLVNFVGRGQGEPGKRSPFINFKTCDVSPNHELSDFSGGFDSSDLGLFPVTLQELRQYLGEGRDWDRHECRHAYNCLLGEIGINVLTRFESEENGQEGGEAEAEPRKCAIARRAVDYRLAVKEYVRERGALLDHWVLRGRDLISYGGSVGSQPSFDAVYAKKQKQLDKLRDSNGDSGVGSLDMGPGLQEDVCSKIVESSLRTNHWYNQKYDAGNL